MAWLCTEVSCPFLLSKHCDSTCILQSMWTNLSVGNVPFHPPFSHSTCLAPPSWLLQWWRKEPLRGMFIYQHTTRRSKQDGWMLAQQCRLVLVCNVPAYLHTHATSPSPLHIVCVHSMMTKMVDSELALVDTVQAGSKCADNGNAVFGI